MHSGFSIFLVAFQRLVLWLKLRISKWFLAKFLILYYNAWFIWVVFVDNFVCLINLNRLDINWWRHCTTDFFSGAEYFKFVFIFNWLALFANHNKWIRFVHRLELQLFFDFNFYFWFSGTFSSFTSAARMGPTCFLSAFIF